MDLNTTASDAKRLIVLDLDDTLYDEADFVASARLEISRRLSEKYDLAADELMSVMEHPRDGENAFDALDRHLRGIAGVKIDESIDWMVDVYRSHMPDIHLAKPVEDALKQLAADKRNCICVLTRGHFFTQTNKAHALGLYRYLSMPPMICAIGKSEDVADNKDDCFRRLHKLPDVTVRISVGDNPATDFATPNGLGWVTIAIADHGRNIHPQNFDDVAPGCRPSYVIDSVAELPAIVESL